MMLNILDSNSPKDDPSVQLAENWRELPKHFRWQDNGFWLWVRAAAAHDGKKADARRRERIAAKEETK